MVGFLQVVSLTGPSKAGALVSAALMHLSAAFCWIVGRGGFWRLDGFRRFEGRFCERVAWA